MKKSDWILIGSVMCIALILFGVQALLPKGADAAVEIQVDGEPYASYPLDENRTVEIDGTNRLEISGGTANMIWADCPDKICVNQKAISKKGESIICLPNRVVVSIAGGEEPEVDAVAN